MRSFLNPQTVYLFIGTTLAGCTNFNDQLNTNDCNDTGYVDSDDGDTGIETEDTGNDDTGIEAAAGVCEFHVLTADGEEVIMGNTLSIQKAQGAASGSQTPSEDLRTLSLQVSNDVPECSSLTVGGLTYMVTWSDKADTDWQPEDIVLIDRDGNIYEGEVTDMGSMLFVDFYLEYEILPGDYGLFSIMMDTTGASTELDDQVRTDLFKNSIIVDDGDTCITLEHEGIAGAESVF